MNVITLPKYESLVSSFAMNIKVMQQCDLQKNKVASGNNIIIIIIMHMQQLTFSFKWIMSLGFPYMLTQLKKLKF